MTAARERTKHFLLCAGTASAALVIFAAYYGGQLTGALRIVPGGSYFGEDYGVFGAENLPLGVALLQTAKGDEHAKAMAVLAAALIFTVCAMAVVVILRRIREAGLSLDWSSLDVRFLAIGAALIAGCFFAGQSLGYRGVHLLFTFPALLYLRRSTADPAVRNLFGLSLAGILFAMWGEFFRRAMNSALNHIGLPTAIPAPAAILFWVARELVWWWIVSLFLALLFLFLSEAAAFRKLGRLGRRRTDARSAVTTAH